MKPTKSLLVFVAFGLLTFTSNAQNIVSNSIPIPVILAAVNNIDFNGNGLATDSYNSHDTNFSTDGQYDPSKTNANGNVASVSGLANLGNLTLRGNLYLGPTATYSVAAGLISGTIYNDYNVNFPDVALPAGANSWTIATPTITTTYTTNVTQIINTNQLKKVITYTTNYVTIVSTNTTPLEYNFQTTGQYILQNNLYPIEVQSGVTVTLNVTATTFNPPSLKIHGGITNSGTAVFYLNGPTYSYMIGNSAIDASNRPENLWYFCRPTLTDMTFSSVIAFAGVVYAPGAALTLNGGGSNVAVLGSIIVKSIVINGHFKFHFDESLATDQAWITRQPANQAGPIGSNATFTVQASGKAPLIYQWFFNQTNLVASGTNYSSLTLTNVQLSDAGNYAVVVSNVYNSMTSSTVSLVVVAPPIITAQPANVLAFPGTNVMFGVSLAGSAPLRFQWQFNGTNLLNATNAIYTVSLVTTNDAGNYSLVVTNATGMTASSNASLTVVLSPDGQTNSAGSTATFMVDAFGPELLNYQWQKNGTNLVDDDNISGSTSNLLTIANLSDADAADYSAIVSNATSSLTTSNATLTVIYSPLIITQPLSQTILAGSNATFGVAAIGAPPLVFQWYHDNFPVGLPTADTNVSFYTITNAQPGDSGNYSVLVTNSYDSVTSSNAILSVYPSAISTLGGISMASDNSFQFTVAGVPGWNYAVQSSTNLIDWISLITNASPFIFTDTNTSAFQQQFYRSSYTPY